MEGGTLEFHDVTSIESTYKKSPDQIRRPDEELADYRYHKNCRSS